LRGINSNFGRVNHIIFTDFRKGKAIKVLNYIHTRQHEGQKMLAVLIDPDKCKRSTLESLAQNPVFQEVDFLFVGGSIVTDGHMRACMELIREITDKTCVIFPGNPNQIDPQAEAILLLSLISGRNPDLLIGKHVESAYKLKESGLEIIPTSYILLDGGKVTAVSYVSNTTPIPQDKPDIAVATALAGAQLGHSITYMDCGSGATYFASQEIIERVRKQVDHPIIVGGGIKTRKDAEHVFNAGADVVVVGNKLEEDPGFLEELVLAKVSCSEILIQKP
jgi:putative glycerol-1-phosphate prenyltransferase